MNKQHTIFLQILKSSLTGTHIESSKELESLTIADWLQLITLAENHKVLPLVYETAHHLISKADQKLARQIKGRMLQQVMLQTVKTADFLKLYSKLLESDIKPLVVKGIICRNLYPKPDLRMSSDEDLLIESHMFDSCHDAFINAGMYTEDEEYTIENSYEVSYRNEDKPLYIELHKSLFAVGNSIYSQWNRFFEDVHKRIVQEEIQGVTIYSMEYTDHLFYLICHAFKHFLHSGFGIRQVCDVVMYANAYGNKINWQKVMENCKAIHADVFAAAVFKIGSNHLNFDYVIAGYPKEWQEIDIDELPMLEDLLSAGIYGGADMSRKHSSNITLNAVSAKNDGKNGDNALLKTLFPSAKNLAGRYPYLRKMPFLLPIAWVDRIIKYGKETAGQKDNSASDAIKIGNQRVELLKQYGVLDR